MTKEQYILQFLINQASTRAFEPYEIEQMTASLSRVWDSLYSSDKSNVQEFKR